MQERSYSKGLGRREWDRKEERDKRKRKHSCREVKREKENEKRRESEEGCRREIVEERIMKEKKEVENSRR